MENPIAMETPIVRVLSRLNVCGFICLEDDKAGQLFQAANRPQCSGRCDKVNKKHGGGADGTGF
jgi:hypothetical protein